MEALAGLRRPDAGVVTVRGQRVMLKSVADALRAGITLAPEDRQTGWPCPRSLHSREYQSRLTGPVFRTMACLRTRMNCAQ